MKTIRRHSASASCERILCEAEHLIHLQGYQGTSLEDIAARCKMTKANLLHHFRSKEELGLAVLDFKIALYRKNCLEPIFTHDSDPIEAVRELFASAGRFHRENGCKAGCFIGNIALEMSDLSERFREKASAFFTEWARCIETSLRRDQARGRLSPKMDAKTASEAVLSLYEGAIMLAKSSRDCRIFDRMGRVATDLLKAHAATKTRADIKHTAQWR